MKLLFIISILAGLLMAAENEDGEYILSPLKSAAKSKDSYYNTLKIPDLYVGRECRENCKEDCCYNVLKDEKGQILRSFSTSDYVVEMARDRYKEKSYLYYSYTHGPEKDRVTDHILVDNNLKSYTTNGSCLDSFDIAVTKDAKVVSVTKSGLCLEGEHILADMNFESALIESDYRGNIGVAGIENSSRMIYVSNLKEIKPVGITLSPRSDRGGVLAVCPSDDAVYVSAYNLINVYNKGLMAGKYDFKTKKAQSGWLFNSEVKNIGFYPSMFLKKDTLYISAKNSSDSSSVHFEVTAEEFSRIDKSAPSREGFENEAMVAFLVGAGTSYLGWHASSDVTDKDDNKYAEAQYEISNSLYKKVWLQGRVGSTQLAISYMKNEAEKVGGLTKKASELLSFFVDFDGLLSDTSTLRIAYESANVNGITTFNDENLSDARNVTPNQKPVEFTSKLERFSLLVMKEKGFYWGGEYTSFVTPTSVGFSGRDKTMEFYGLDSEFGIKNAELVMGYDTASYAKRYETNFSTFYVQGLIGGGLSFYDMSSDFRDTMQQAATDKKIVSSDYSIVLDAELQVGYLWQQRIKMLKGFGHSLEFGVKARGIYTGSGQSDNKDSSSDTDTRIEENEITIEMSRYDVWYGPFINYNIIF